MNPETQRHGEGAEGDRGRGWLGGMGWPFIYRGAFARGALTARKPICCEWQNLREKRGKKDFAGGGFHNGPFARRGITARKHEVMARGGGGGKTLLYFTGATPESRVSTPG